MKVVNLILVSVLLFAAVVSAAPAPGSLTRILIPVFTTSLPGAFGSIWSTELWGLLDSNSGYLFPLFIEPLPLPSGDLPAPLRTHVLMRLYTTSSSFPGALIYVDAAQSDRVHLALRLTHEGSSPGQPVDLPIVREKDFLTGTSHLLAIPHRPGLRLTLRVYDLNIHPGASVDVKVFDAHTDLFGNDRMIGEAVLPFTYSSETVRAGIQEFTAHPGAIQINLDQTFPGITSDLLRVEITPSPELMTHWAFITATDNATQEVVLVTPR